MMINCRPFSVTCNSQDLLRKAVASVQLGWNTGADSRFHPLKRATLKSVFSLLQNKTDATKMDFTL